MITLSQYFMGRDKLYPNDLTPAIVEAAAELLRRTNLLLAEAERQGVEVTWHVNSGWRPPAINASTPNAAPRSKHMTGHAIDVGDPEGGLDEWLLQNKHLLGELDLAMEHPAATKGWCHLQFPPPSSGNRIFYP
jgi:hypothetical protein